MTDIHEAEELITSSEFAIAQQLNESRKNLRRAIRRNAVGREPEWAAAALRDLAQIESSLTRHREGARGPYCHYEALCLQAQWLIPRIVRLIARFDDVEFQASLLGHKLAKVAAGEILLVQEARSDSARVLRELRRTLAEESAVDLESFNEPPALD